MILFTKYPNNEGLGFNLRRFTSKDSFPARDTSLFESDENGRKIYLPYGQIKQFWCSFIVERDDSAMMRRIEDPKRAKGHYYVTEDGQFFDMAKPDILRRVKQARDFARLLDQIPTATTSSLTVMPLTSVPISATVINRINQAADFARALDQIPTATPTPIPRNQMSSDDYLAVLFPKGNILLEHWIIDSLNDSALLCISNEMDVKQCIGNIKCRLSASTLDPQIIWQRTAQLYSSDDINMFSLPLSEFLILYPRALERGYLPPSLSERKAKRVEDVAGKDKIEKQLNSVFTIIKTAVNDSQKLLQFIDQVLKLNRDTLDTPIFENIYALINYAANKKDVMYPMRLITHGLQGIDLNRTLEKAQGRFLNRHEVRSCYINFLTKQREALKQPDRDVVIEELRLVKPLVLSWVLPKPSHHQIQEGASSETQIKRGKYSVWKNKRR